MQLAATQADVWETSFCTPAEFQAQNTRFANMGGGRDVVRSLEIDGFVARTSGDLSRLLDRVRSERGGTEDLEPVLERALVGVPSDAVARLRELQAAGVDQVVVALHDPHDPDAIHALAQTAALLRD